MNYRERQIRHILKQEQAKWGIERQNLQQDILNLENSIDAQVLNQEREQKQKLQTLLDDTVNLLGAEDIKNLSDLKTLLKGETLKSLLSLYQQKIADSDQALINLAKQKLKSKKEAQTLVEQIETNWKADRDTWERERGELEENWKQAKETWTNTEQDYLKQIQTQKESIQTKDTKINELNEWSRGQHERIEELETAEQTLLREKENLITQHQTQLQREQDLGEQKLQEAKQVFGNYREQKEKELNEQKTFYETKFQAQENQIKTHEQIIAQLNQQIVNYQTTNTDLQHANQQQQNTLQAREESIRNHTQRIAQLEEYLRVSQQEGQNKQTQITNLNQANTNLQTKITELTQTQTENTRTIQALNQANLDRENELINERTDRRQAETSLQEAQAKLTQQRTVLEQLLTNRESDSMASGAGFCLWCHQQHRLVTNKQICHICDSKRLDAVQTEQQELAEQEITLIKEALHD